LDRDRLQLDEVLGGIHRLVEAAEMARREDMLGIAEKLPKSSTKQPKLASPHVAARRPIVALEGRVARKRH
ncbi:MAG: hypothetical protein JSV48_03795, partial [Bradyrhizobium sp.]